MRILIPLLLLLQVAAAHAATIGVRVRDGDGSPLAREVVEAVVWHAAAQVGEHDPALLDPEATPAEVERVLREAGATTLFDLEVRWGSEARYLQGGRVAMLPIPIVTVVDHALRPEGLVEIRRAEAAANPAVERAGGALFVAPELALQRAVSRAMDAVRTPAWGERAQVRSLPVVVAADAAWKARHGVTWRAEIGVRIALASRLLQPVGIRLDVVAEDDWTAPVDLPTLSARLRHLAAQPRVGPDTAIRIGFTGVAPVARPGGPEQVGRAFEPGRDVVIVDQRGVVDDGSTWDVSNEAVAVAHEVMHALGVPHDEAAGTLMSAHHRGLVHGVGDRALALAKAAVQARTAHWDPASALMVLAAAADRWFVGRPTRQLSYIVGNLLEVPPPGAVAPGSTAPIVDAALSRLYLDLASASPESAATHTAAALSHAGAVRAGDPWLADQLGSDVAPTAHQASLDPSDPEALPVELLSGR